MKLKTEDFYETAELVDKGYDDVKWGSHFLSHFFWIIVKKALKVM